MTQYAQEYRDKLLTLQTERVMAGGVLEMGVEIHRAVELDDLWKKMTPVEQQIAEGWWKGPDSAPRILGLIDNLIKTEKRGLT